MQKYDYKNAVTNDILDYIAEHEADIANFEDIDDYAEHLNETLWIEDSVTGNASGSYTFNYWQAEQNICHNLDLIQEVIAEFGRPDNNKAESAEFWDVSIRCYLLSGCIAEIVESDDFAELWEKHHPEEEEEDIEDDQEDDQEEND